MVPGFSEHGVTTDNHSGYGLTQWGPSLEQQQYAVHLQWLGGSSRPCSTLGSDVVGCRTDHGSALGSDHGRPGADVNFPVRELLWLLPDAGTTWCAASGIRHLRAVDGARLGLRRRPQGLNFVEISLTGTSLATRLKQCPTDCSRQASAFIALIHC